MRTTNRPRWGVSPPSPIRPETMDSNSRPCSATGIGGSWLVTPRLTSMAPSKASSMRMGVPGVAKPTAFSTSLSSICAARSGAPRTHTGQDGSTTENARPA